MGIRWSNFLLRHHDQDKFLTSTWQPDPTRIHPLYLAYRLIFALALIGLLIGYIDSLTYDKSLFPIFLTHWGFSLIVLFHIMDFVFLSVEFAKQRKENYGGTESLGYLGRTVWIVCNVASAAAPFISAFYWAVLYDPATGDTANFWNVLVHGLNSVFVYIEMFITARPWRWEHFYQSAILGLIYVAFSLIYYVAGGKGKEGNSYIYSVLDWENDPGKAVGVSVGAIFAVCVCHLINYGLFLLRELMADKCLGEKRSNRVRPAEIRIQDGESGRY